MVSHVTILGLYDIFFFCLVQQIGKVVSQITTSFLWLFHLIFADFKCLYVNFSCAGIRWQLHLSL